MKDLVSLIGIAIAVFVSTNVDDTLILSAMYSDPHLKARSIVAGQFLGIGTIVVVSAIAALAAHRHENFNGVGHLARNVYRSCKCSSFATLAVAATHELAYAR